MTSREYLEDQDAEEPDDFVISLTAQVSGVVFWFDQQVRETMFYFFGIKKEYYQGRKERKELRYGVQDIL